MKGNAIKDMRNIFITMYMQKEGYSFIESFFILIMF
jgi:hypothetical protein